MKGSIKKLVKKRILAIKPYKPGKPIEEVKRELGLRSVIKMASNENTLSPSSRVLSEVRKSLASLNRYPDGGCFYLKKALAKRFRLKPENVIVGNGSDELIILALRAFARPGDEVIVAKPTFLIYEIASKVEGVKIITVPMKNFRYDLSGMAKRLNRKTKIVFVANPDNPTGTYATEDEVRRFLKKVGPRTIVFFDEAYYEFAQKLYDYPKTLPYLRRKNIIITRTFSKIYALAGLRIGYGLAKKELIEAMDKVREPFNVNSVAQIASLAALRDRGFVSKSLRLIDSGRKYIYHNLKLLGYEYIPSATNFILINLMKDSGKIYNKLLKKGIIVREMSAWGLNGFIRVTIGTPKENKKFIETLKKVTQ